MKNKYILLAILSCLIIFIIFNKCYKNEVNVLSINSLYEKENYNNYLIDLFSNTNNNYTLNIDYSNDNIQIENIIAKIDNNENNIQSKIHKSEVIILSIGNVDYKNEELNIIIRELDLLFKKIRLINNKQIIYISPSIIRNTTQIKEICHKYNITFLNGSSFRNNNQLLAELIFKKINNIYSKKIKNT